MKFLASILVFTILALTIAPVSQIYSLKEECADECCSANDGSADECQGPDCCPTGICNPFQICACCVTIPSESEFQFTIYHTEINSNPAVKELALSDYKRECWQPPEMRI